MTNIGVILFGFVVVITKSLVITNKNVSHSDIICPLNDDCAVNCDVNNGTYCNELTLTCQNSINGTCVLFCIGDGACQSVKLYANNSNSVLILCSNNNACINIESQIALYDETSMAQIQCVGNASCYNSTFIIDTPSLNMNSPINIVNNIPRIQANCIGKESCKHTKFSIIGVDSFTLNCDGQESCKNGELTVTSLNEAPAGDLTINCMEDESCKNTLVIGISLQDVYVNCGSGINACQNIQVYCPVFPFGAVTTNKNNPLYYDPTNIDPHTCNIVLGDAGQGSDIYSPYGTNAVNIVGNSEDDNVHVYCEFDWFNQISYVLLGSNRSPDSQKCNEISFLSSFISTLVNNPNYVVFSNPRMNTVKCDIMNDCVLYISQQLNTYESDTLNIECSNTDHICSIICMSSYACRSAILNGTQTQTLQIQSTQVGSYHGKDMIVYGPNGDNSVLSISNVDADYAFAGTIIQSQDTKTITLQGSGAYAFHNVTLYANGTGSINIECQGFYSCSSMKVYIYDETFSNFSFPIDTIQVICTQNNSCNNMELFVMNNDILIWNCMFQYESNWNCVTNAPTASPTNMPTITPSQSPSNFPTRNPTLEPTKTPVYIPTETPSISPSLNPTIPATFNPTISPTIIASISPTQTPTSKEAFLGEENSRQGQKVVPLQYVVTIGVVLVVLGILSCLVPIIIYCLKFKNKNDNTIDIDSPGPISMTSPKSFHKYNQRTDTMNTMTLPQIIQVHSNSIMSYNNTAIVNVASNYKMTVIDDDLNDSSKTGELSVNTTITGTMESREPRPLPTLPQQSSIDTNGTELLYASHNNADTPRALSAHF